MRRWAWRVLSLWTVRRGIGEFLCFPTSACIESYAYISISYDFTPGQRGMARWVSFSSGTRRLEYSLGYLHSIPGDMGISVPTQFVSTNDLLPTKNALSTMFAAQNPTTGALPESGPPLSQTVSTFFFYSRSSPYSTQIN